MEIIEHDGITNGAEWAEPKQVTLAIDGWVVARGEVNAIRLEEGIMGCSNDECINCIESEVVIFTFRLPPPKEAI